MRTVVITHINDSMRNDIRHSGIYHGATYRQTRQGQWLSRSSMILYFVLFTCRKKFGPRHYHSRYSRKKEHIKINTGK